jgi:hypothetical protein
MDKILRPYSFYDYFSGDTLVRSSGPTGKAELRRLRPLKNAAFEKKFPKKISKKSRQGKEISFGLRR